MSGFGAFKNNPKAYETTGPSAGAMQLLLNALGQVGDNAVTVGNNAGTSIANDKLNAMTEEERNKRNLIDEFSGLALTDQFRKRMEQDQSDKAAQDMLAKQNEYAIASDERQNQYDIAGDARKYDYASRLANTSAINQMSRLKERLSGTSSGTGKSTIDPKKKIENDGILMELEKGINSHLTAISARDTQDGVGLEEKAAGVAKMQQMKYELLLENGVPEVTARKALDVSPAMKALMKQIEENNKYNTKTK